MCKIDFSQLCIGLHRAELAKSAEKSWHESFSICCEIFPLNLLEFHQNEMICAFSPALSLVPVASCRYKNLYRISETCEGCTRRSPSLRFLCLSDSHLYGCHLFMGIILRWQSSAMPSIALQMSTTFRV